MIASPVEHDGLPTANLPYTDDHPECQPNTFTALHASDDPKLRFTKASIDNRIADGTSDKNAMDARSKLSSLLKDKEQEWTDVVKKEGPLRLLDLPLDVLKEIIKEVTHTNDLTALALTHSALHDLAIPHIYSRFDIVWPDAHATTDPRTGVDALTYGLATLCMGNIFTPMFQDQFPCMNCGTINTAECTHGMALGPKDQPRRWGNQYPQFTRKFSLGNGPPDWVQEYLITKESGKMLGTLVALAVARMVNLETFVWDMPTGVLRDVWMALSSLQTRSKSRDDCRLELVWVRWHDNSETSHLPPAPNPSSTGSPISGSNMTSIGWTFPSSLGAYGPSGPLTYSRSRFEYPTLSLLPPLKSLSVLDIDELNYLDEMSVLVAKSKDRLRELRIGMAEKAYKRDFANTWDGPDLHQVDHNASWPGNSTIGERRLGGVLGTVLGRVYDIRKSKKARIEKQDAPPISVSSTATTPAQLQPSESHITQPIDIQNSSSLQEYISAAADTEFPATMFNMDANTHQGNILNPETTYDINGQPLASSPASLDLYAYTPPEVAPITTYLDSPMALIPGQSIGGLTAGPQDLVKSTVPIVNTADANSADHAAVALPVSSEQVLRRSQSLNQKQSLLSDAQPVGRQKLDGRLRLQTLELERVPLSVAVLQKGFDWSVMTSLTILDCQQHDPLWIMLRKQFQPTSMNSSHASSKHSASSPLQYHLNLKKIHTDAASPALISFLKETLAPNTLEVLFLQDRKRASGTNVKIDAIYRGPLKRHRASLKKLMLDSSNGIPRSPVTSSDNPRWRAWVPNREVLNFITSGRMSSLRELSMAIDYKDWHHFLQRLPQVPHLRSINIPFVADHVTPAFDPRELAMQVVDVIVLRPELELCYMGISHKCFEILENRPHDESHGSHEMSSNMVNGGPENMGNFTEDEDGASDEEGSEEDDDDDDDNDTQQVDPDATESELSDHDDSDSDSDGFDDGRSKVRLRLREILFYDDKVAIFKARHGKL
ncbi:hypothetical protein BJ878DRAFT_37032 [Calycina marina]|uniref:F-box domain-containing protein n=1 Tax=Calycina marina TaxID=1763456 RepID=A0A9P7ZAG0_9HELO|nr:hypothetical protein BJ878DRAFT_37032 [Calycina marina]